MRQTNTRLPAISDQLRNEMDRLLNSFWETKLTPFGAFADFGQRTAGEWLPAINVRETEESIIVDAEVPGVDPKDIEVTVQADMLTIKGEKQSCIEEKDEGIQYAERRFGSFLRQIQLPAPVDENKVEATSNAGVLTITLHKSPSVLPKHIPVHAK